jgi:2-iminobutanoate/2-iminopropanoate deaminase
MRLRQGQRFLPLDGKAVFPLFGQRWLALRRIGESGVAEGAWRAAMVDAVDPANVWSPFGAFSLAVIQGDGQIVHLKGQVSLDAEGSVVGPNDMRIQVRQVLENIRAVLQSMGGTMGDIVSIVNHATNIDSFMSAADVRREFLSAPFPVNTTVQVVRLYRPELLIEMTAIAEIPRDRFHRPAS